MRIRIHGLLCALALLGSAKAAQAAEAPEAMQATPAPAHPTMQDMAKWKSDFLSRYDDIVYLDERSGNISEDGFFARVVAEQRAFSMQVDSGAPKRLTIRLLGDAGHREAQAGVK